MNLLALRAAVDRLKWQSVPDLMLELYEKSAGVAESVRAIKEELGYHPDTRGIFWNPDTKQLWMSTADSEESEHVAKWQKALEAIDGVEAVQIEAESGPPGRNDEDTPWVKVAGNNARGLFEALNYLPNKLNAAIPGLHSPLGAALTSGLIGAGLGYAGGTALEHVLPGEREEGKLRRTLALVGGLGAAAPAAIWGGVNLANDKSLLEGWPLEGPAAPEGPAQPVGEYEPVFRTDIPRKSPQFTRKFAEFDTETGLMTRPLVNVNAFNQTIWGDPRVSQHLSPVMQAAASGLVTGAATLAGGGRPAKLITPLDIGRMAAGMGSGYLSGALVGKALGILAGVPEETQDRLKQTGMYAGVIANMVPLAFGGS